MLSISFFFSFLFGVLENSYEALEKYKSQFSEQARGLRKHMENTSLIVEGMEETFVSLFPLFFMRKSFRFF